MDSYPTNENQTKLAYNRMMILISLGTCILVAWMTNGGWLGLMWLLPLIVAFGWTALFFFDMYIRSWYWPESEMTDEERFDALFEGWMSKQSDDLKRQVKDLEVRSDRLQKELDEIKRGG